MSVGSLSAIRGRFSAMQLAVALMLTTFLAFALSAGVPALRHDWWMSAHAAGLRAQTLAGAATWNNDGLGRPALYPNNYLFYLPLGLLAQLLPPVGVLGVALLGFAFVCALAAQTFARLGRSAAFEIGALSILLFNPWTYTQLVAGHLPMLVAYAGMAWFAAEVSKGRRASPLRLSLAAILIAQQVQFLLIFLLAGVLTGALLGIWQPLVAALVVALPVGIGVPLGRGELAGIPYTLAWERSQSLHLLSALQLRGYFAQYARALGVAAALGEGLLALAAFAALLVARSRHAVVAAIVVIGAALITTGTQGPIAGPYGFVVTHVKATGAFRELYDLIALVAVGYVALLAFAVARTRAFAAVAFAIGALFLAAWLHGPPARYWVPGAWLPEVATDAPATTRIARSPAFQPLRFGTRGSGADPDIYDRPRGVTTLNTYLPAYPASVALARYAATGDTQLLRALSVSRIIQRPWLCTNVASLAAQTASRDVSPACGRDRAPVSLDALPELTLSPRYAIGSLETNVGAGNVLAADAGAAGLIDDADAPRALRVANTQVDARTAWVDARLFFAQIPAIGQAYGGAYTESSQPIALPQRAALTWVRGTLRSSTGRLLTTTTHGYRWVDTGAGGTVVRCSGRCAIAATAASVPREPRNPPPNPSVLVRGDAVLPWLWRVALPALAPGEVLRLNVAYTPYWQILHARHSLVHVRLDGAVNGWVVRRAQSPRRAYIVEMRSAALQLAEIASILLLVVLFAFGMRSTRA